MHVDVVVTCLQIFQSNEPSFVSVCQQVRELLVGELVVFHEDVDHSSVENESQFGTLFGYGQREDDVRSKAVP